MIPCAALDSLSSCVLLELLCPPPSLSPLSSTFPSRHPPLAQGKGRLLAHVGLTTTHRLTSPDAADSGAPGESERPGLSSQLGHFAAVILGHLFSSSPIFKKKNGDNNSHSKTHERMCAKPQSRKHHCPIELSVTMGMSPICVVWKSLAACVY